MKNGLPKSNYGPCMCNAQKGDALEGIPDLVQRPARKEVSLRSIGPNKEASGKGYKVVEAISGAAAIEWLSKPENQVDIVFSDVVMPGMCGGEAAPYGRAEKVIAAYARMCKLLGAAGAGAA